MESSNFIHVQSDEEYKMLVQTSGDRLIVVDFFAEWCPPCKNIAPFYQQLSEMYPHVSFLKVDVDILQLTAQSAGIKGMPTFHFYKNGNLLSQFSGADSKKLEFTLQSLAGIPFEKEIPFLEKSPFRFFPFQGNLVFDGTKNLPAIQKKIIEQSCKFLENEDTKSYALTATETISFKKLITTLSNTSFYHASSFEKNEYSALLKLIQWPQENCFPALDTLRLIVLHPHAALHYAESYTNNGSDSILDITLSFLLDKSLPATNHLMVWRLFANLFKEEKGRTATIITVFDQVIDLAKTYSIHNNPQLRLAVVTTLLNFSVEFAKNSVSYDNKSQIVQVLLEMIIPEESAETSYRLVIALGTCAYKEQEIKKYLKENQLKLAPLELQKEGEFMKLVEPLKELKTLIESEE